MGNKGFSLVELIVVIAIMAILVGVAVPVYTSYIEKAQKASDEQYLSDVVYSAQLFAAENGLILDKLAIAPEVKADTQQGIELFAKDGDRVYRVEDLSALYDMVGGYTFSTKETDTEVKYHESTPPPDSDDPEAPEHTHVYTEVIQVKSCVSDGIWGCAQCSATQVEPTEGHVLETDYIQLSNLRIYSCTVDGCEYMVGVPSGSGLG